MLRKILLTMCTILCFCLLGGDINGSSYDKATVGLAEAAGKTSVELTPRELKKDRKFESSDLYARAHHLIYGKKGPLGPDGRVRVAVVVNGAEGIVVENRIKNQIYQQLRNKFPRDTFAVMKGTDVTTYLLTRAEDDRYDVRKGISTINEDEGKPYHPGGKQQNDLDGVPVGEKPRGLADMKLSDYVNAGRKYNYDYVFVLTMSFGDGVRYDHNYIPVIPSILSPLKGHTNKQNIWVRARFVDVTDGEYVYRNDVVATGKKHHGGFNGRVFEDGVKEAVEEILDDIMVNED